MAVQFIRDRTKTKWYVYAFKGGPKVMTHVGPRKPKLGPSEHRKIAEALAEQNAGPTHLFQHVIAQWLRSEEWQGLEPTTKRTWGTHVTRIEDRWGKFPYSVWNDPQMASKVVKWRDLYKATPRAADIGVTVLRALLKWAKLNGYINLNAALDIPQLAKSADREDIIWTEDDIIAFTAKAIELERPQLVDGLRLAKLTGLRRADLVTLTFDHIGEFAINKTALKKSRGKRRKAVVPMTPELDELLAELRTRYRADGVGTVLVNSFGRPWSVSGFGGSFGRVTEAAGITYSHEDVVDGQLVTLTANKHLHDVRGTFCTLLIVECELTDEQAAEIMAWSPKRVAAIRKKYVDGHRVVVAIGERIAARRKTSSKTISGGTG